MTRYELLIEFPDGNRQYLNTFTYEPISLNYDIANIKDISGRNSAYSKTIKLPDDAHNREMLGYITNLAVDSTVDANKIIKAWIMVDTICVFEGVLQLKKFDKNFKNGEFDIEVVVYADNDTFFTLMGDKYLTDMDFSEYDHIWASQSIVNSWTQSFENGYVYPLIDYGSNWVYEDVSGYGSGTLSVATMSVSVDEMFPSTYVRPIIDRIFISNGFSYQSEFFQTEEFKRLIIPFNETYIQGPTASDKEFRVGLYSYTHSFTPPSNSSPALKLIVPYDNETTPNGDPNNLWNTSSFYFTNVDQLIYQRFGWFFDFTIPPDVGGYLWIHTYRSRDLNGATNSNWAGGTGNLVATRQIFYNNGSSYEGQWNPTTRRLLYGWRTPFINMFPGENLRVVVEFKFDNSPLIINESYLFNELASSIPVGGQILYNNCIPKKIKQKDFFLSLCKMFNLYIEPSKEYPNTLIVEPRDEYYANGTIKDWSRKLDLNQNIENDILAQTQDKIILYSHKEDKDAINQDYKSTFNEIYGQYEYNSPNEFAKATKKIETIFSPTPLVSLLGSFNFPIPVIVKDFLYSYNNNAAGRLQSNIRILYWGGLVNFAQYGVSDQFGFSNIIFPYYPYAGHLDNPYESNYDINFGQPEDIYFREPSNGLTDNNLFNNYWYKTMFELTNKDSRLLTANFYLTAEDIYKFKFSDKIYLEFDGNGQYYKVNKIFDYDPGTAKTCKIELIKSDEVQVNTFIPKYSSSKPGKTTRPNVASGNKVEGVGTGNVNGVGNQLDGSKTTINGDNNNVSGDTTNVFGDNNNVGGDTNIVNGDDNTVNSGTKTTITNGDDNFIDMGVGDTFINGDENKIYVQVDKSITSGDNNSVGTYSTNIYTYGDNNTIGTASQNIYTFGNNNTFADGVTSSFVIGDNTFVTQSNAVYISGNIIFSGTISGSFSIPIGLQDVLDYDNIDDSTQFSIEPDNNVILGRTNSSITGFGADNILFGNNNDIINSTGAFASGLDNIINFSNATFIHGYQNTATNSFFSGIFGQLNQSTGNWNLISGQSNKAYFSTAGLISGIGNYITQSLYGAILGGVDNGIQNATSSVVIGGHNHLIDDIENSVVIGGFGVIATQSNTVYLPNLYITGDISINGTQLDLGASFSVIGGTNNYIYGNSTASIIAGGDGNYVSASAYSVIVGGQNNYIELGQFDTILGSLESYIYDSEYSNIVASKDSYIVDSSASSIFGSELVNIDSSTQSSIISSYQNSGLTNSENSSLISTYNSKASNSDSLCIIGGSGHNIFDSDTSFVASARQVTIQPQLPFGDGFNRTMYVIGGYSATYDGYCRNIMDLRPYINQYYNVIDSFFQNSQFCTVYDLTGFDMISCTSVSATMSASSDSSLNKCSFIEIQSANNCLLNFVRSSLIYRVDYTSMFNCYNITADGVGYSLILNLYNSFIYGITASTILAPINLSATASYNISILGSENLVIDGLTQSEVIGGTGNVFKSSQYSLMAGGNGNFLTQSIYSQMIGGISNSLYDSYNSIIIGGSNNQLQTSFQSGVIIGGINNTIGPINGGWSTIVGGDTNTITGFYANISGGVLNNIGLGTYSNGNYSFIGGGWGNAIYSTQSSPCRESGIVGGFENLISTRWSFIGGGYQNNIKSSATQSCILGGKSNIINNSVERSVILGGRNITALQNDTAYVPNLISKSDTPSSTVQSSAGTGATVSITGTNIAGSISITAGTGTGTGQILSATFSNSFSYPNGCSVVLFASNSLGASYGPLVYATGTTNAWSVFVTSPLSTGQTYTWNYQVIGY